MRGIAGKRPLEPEWRIEIDGEERQRCDRFFHRLVHRIDVFQDGHLEETNFLPHEPGMVNRRAITDPDLFSESRAEL